MATLPISYFPQTLPGNPYSGASSNMPAANPVNTTSMGFPAQPLPLPSDRLQMTSQQQPFMAPMQAPLQPITTQTQVPDQQILQQALNLLGQIQNLPADVAYIRHMGLTPVFNSGMEALRLIQDRNIRVEFGDMGDTAAHAQWLTDQNLIMINQKYRGDASPETLYAISEAIYHEAGHAFGNGDGESSVQEELNCLALNVLANRYHQATDPNYARSASSSPLIADGVALYSRLFFDVDPLKQALINRVVLKYGDLPLWSPGHAAPPPAGLDGRSPLPIAYRVVAQAQAKNNQATQIPSPQLSYVA